MIVAISDLHMSHGPLDDFTKDDHLVEFLAAVQELFDRKAAAGEEPNVLVLNGDILDMLAVDAPDHATKIDAIAQAHPGVFAQLRVLGEAHPVLYLRGNHDWDAFRPEAIGALRDALPELQIPANDRVQAAGGVCERGVFTTSYDHPSDGRVRIRIEHGHQHESFNNFFHDDPANPETSMGSLLVTHFGRMMEAFFPNVDNLCLQEMLGAIRKSLQAVTDAYELDGVSADAPRPGFFGRLVRAIRKLADDIRSEANEQKRELMLRIASIALGALEGSTDSLGETALGLAGDGRSIVVFGHTHVEDSQVCGEAIYLNSGAWTSITRFPEDAPPVTSTPCSYVAVNFNRPLALLPETGQGIRYFNGIL